MSLGDYDETEHERRERKVNEIDTDVDDDREQYQGELVFDSGDSAEDLLNQFNQLNTE